MGDKIPLPVDVAPVPAGISVPLCWGVGKDFGDLPTPSQLILRISGVIKSDLWQASDGEPQNGEYVLQQNTINPFLFRDDTIGKEADAVFFPFATVINARSTTFVNYFLFGSLPICQLFVDNGIENPFKGGSARIWLPEVQV